MVLFRLFSNAPSGRHGLLVVLAYLVALLSAIVLHELAHGLVALWNGDSTAKLYGRLTLNPIKHFDWIGLIMMLVVGFGWAKPVPVNLANFKNRKVGAITVSIAGVLTNLVLAFLGAMAYVLLLKATPKTESAQYTVYFFEALAKLILQLNVSFALFNILPLFPLDGYRLLSCFVNENNSAMAFIRKYSLYILLGCMVLNSIPYLCYVSPLYWYVGEFGELIQIGFESFWRLIFHG